MRVFTVEIISYSGADYGSENSVANIIDDVLAYAIGSAEAATAPRRLLFLVFGTITVF
jgi:hypothetical protein